MGKTTLRPTLLLATTTATTWFPSCPSTETSSTCCPRIWATNTTTCRTLPFLTTRLMLSGRTFRSGPTARFQALTSGVKRFQELRVELVIVFRNGAGNCDGAATETRPCYNIRDCCNLKGVWGGWSEWSKCFPACGSSNSKKFREKICTPDYSVYSEKITFHGRPCADCGALPDGETTMVESLPCTVPECLQGRRFV